MESNFTSKVIGLGRITIPSITRELLELNPGDFVEVTVRKKNKSEPEEDAKN